MILTFQIKVCFSYRKKSPFLCSGVYCTLGQDSPVAGTLWERSTGNHQCAFLKEKVKYLVHIVSKGEAADPEKTAKVKTWPVPSSVKEVQQFLRLANYYRRFIRDFASIAKPLHKLTEKNSSFLWTKECQQSFETLREQLSSSPVPCVIQIWGVISFGHRYQ